MRYGNFEVWITSSSYRFQEYCTLNPEPRQPGPHVVKTYIESQRGEAFSVNWRVDGGQDSLLCITTRMDGVLIDQHATPSGMVGHLQGVRCGARSIRPFQFSSAFDLQSTYSVDLSNNRLNEGFGTIELTIAPIRALKSSVGQISGPLSIDGLPILGQAPHCIAVGEERTFANDGLQVHPPIIPLMPALDVELKVKETITFIFRYRSRGQLKTLGILPHTETAQLQRSEGSGEGATGASAPNVRGNQGAFSATTLGKRPRNQFDDSGDAVRFPRDDPEHRLEELRRTMGGVSHVRDSAASTGTFRQDSASGPSKLAQNVSIMSEGTSTRVVV